MTDTFPFPPGAKPFHDGPHFQVAARDHGSDIVVVTFAERKEPAPADFFAIRFLEKEACSYVAVRSLRNEWYLGPEMEQVFAAIRLALEQIPHRKLILFGYSMGSFGVIRAANLFMPDRIIISGPVASLDPAVERRWLSDYRDLLPEYAACAADILPFRKPFETIAFLDPGCEDAAHVDILERSADLRRLEIAGAGHLVLTYLRDSGVLGTVMRMLMRPEPDLSAMARLIRQARKTNRSYLLSLSARLGHRAVLQERVLNYAVRTLPEDMGILLARACLSAQQRNLGDARKAILDVVAKHGPRCFGVALGKAITAFATAGGDPAEIAVAVALFASERKRSREVQLWYSRFLRASGEFDAAFAAHESFMTGDTFEAHAHIERGHIFEHFELWHAARDSYRKACEYAPNFPPARQNLTRMERMIP